MNNSLQEYLNNVFLNFIEINNLAVQLKYSHQTLFDGQLELLPKDNLRKEIYDINSVNSNGLMLEKMFNIPNWERRMFFYDYKLNLFCLAYCNASKEHKREIEKNLPFAMNLDDVIKSLKEKPNDLKEFIIKSKQYNNVIKNINEFVFFVEVLQKELSKEDFHDVIFTFLKFNEKLCNQDKNKLGLEYILKNYITDNEILSYFNINNQNINDDVFNDEFQTFDILVDKKKIHNYINLKDVNDFNDMYELSANFLSKKEHWESLKVVSFKKDEKFKSAQNFSFLFKVNKNSNLDENYFKKLVLAILKEFEIESKKSIEKKNKFEQVNLNRINKILLNFELKDVSKVKKIKM